MAEPTPSPGVFALLARLVPYMRRDAWLYVIAVAAAAAGYKHLHFLELERIKSNEAKEKEIRCVAVDCCVGAVRGECVVVVVVVSHHDNMCPRQYRHHQHQTKRYHWAIVFS